MLRTIVAALLAAFALTVHAETPPKAQVPPPPPLPDKSQVEEQSGFQPEPQVSIIQKGDETITEYRLNGKLYMVKVQPKVGPAYYLLDEAGNGQMKRFEGKPNLKPPMWVLFKF